MTKTSGKWEFPVDAPWFWPNNMTYYHFRVLSPKDQSVTITDNKDYVTLTSAQNYTDVIWGAPMLDNANDDTHGTFKWTYDAKNNKGFDFANALLESGNHQIYHAIGPTDNTIKLILFHMMSDVTFKITTKSDDSSDKVILGDGTGDEFTNKTKLELVDYYSGGKLQLGDGLVIPTETNPKTTNILGPIYAGDSNNKLTWGIVPQSLDGVKLRITTPDHNQYIVDLANITVNEEPTTTNIANPYEKVGGTGADKDKYKIDRWYPGFKYSYTFKLSKKQIESITATVVDWEDVVAGDENVQIQ